MLDQPTAADLVRTLDCPPGASMEFIQARVAELHQKDIVLNPQSDANMGTLTGLWVEMPTTSIILYRENDPLIYQAHSIFHEFGHILADHNTCNVLDYIDMNVLGTAPLGGQIQRARARGFRHDEAENLAEEFAYALSRVVLAGTTTGPRTVWE